ncbi:MAG TPA: metal-dependent transcriptional regulator, partial [Deltaproteobacteria bacterium]|nr:metal-dependent transcriptional regulator [Deltaproteobacteria bacterium]
EFEHMLDTGLLNSVCILLGHPKECPHGKPIPEGECCRRNAKVAESSVIPLTDLETGVCAHIAYVNGNENGRVQKMGVLQIRPGGKVSVIQKYPCYVLDCEGGNVAMGNEEVSSIYVWKPSGARPCDEECTFPLSNDLVGKKRGWGFKSRWKQRACRRR